MKLFGSRIFMSRKAQMSRMKEELYEELQEHLYGALLQVHKPHLVVAPGEFIYSPLTNASRGNKPQVVPVEVALQMLLDHLGVELKYTPEQPARTTITKKEKKK